MRFRELLAANAFCLLALFASACEKYEQPIGAYSADPAASGQEPSSTPQLPGTPRADGGWSVGEPLPPAVVDADPEGNVPPMTDAGPGSRPSFGWPTPTLLDAGSTATPSAGPQCELEIVEARRRRLDMYLMIDNNGTLPATGAWEDIADGLSRFARDERSIGTGLGIRYFGSSCNALEYAQPTIDFDVLPAHARRIIDSTQSRRWTASPMLPALEGGLTHQRRRALRHPESKQVLVLISDALTQDFTCPYTTQELAETARDGLMSVPSIETHVIGVGVTTALNDQLDQLIVRNSAYNTIASAGGSGQAVLTDIRSDGGALNEALQTIRRKAAPCEFHLPPGDVASSQLGVARYPLAEELREYDPERGCGTEQGWFYAVDNLPTPIVLCPATCDWLRRSDENRIALLISCLEP